LRREGGRLEGIGCASSSERGAAAAAMCYEGGEGAFSAKLERGQRGHSFRNVALDATVRNARYSSHGARCPRRFVSPTAGAPRVYSSASSHGPLTAHVDACRWRAQQLLGGPNPSLPREGVFASQAPGGYCRYSGYRGIPVHLLLGSFNGPASAQA
jgi:hypothetical protein